MDYRLLIPAPAMVGLIYVVYRLAVGRPLQGRDVRVGLSLILVGYFAATAALGI